MRIKESLPKFSHLIHQFATDFDEYPQGINPNLMLYMQMLQKRQNSFTPMDTLKWGGLALAGSHIFDTIQNSPSKRLERINLELKLKQKERELEDFDSTG